VQGVPDFHEVGKPAQVIDVPAAVLGADNVPTKPCPQAARTKSAADIDVKAGRKSSCGQPANGNCPGPINLQDKGIRAGSIFQGGQ